MQLIRESAESLRRAVLEHGYRTEERLGGEQEVLYCLFSRLSHTDGYITPSLSLWNTLEPSSLSTALSLNVSARAEGERGRPRRHSHS